MKAIEPMEMRLKKTMRAALTLMLTTCVLVCSPGRSTHAQEPDRQLVQTGSTNTNSSKRIALVIGNGAYASAPTLKNPPNDARDMAATLKMLGFDVTSGINVNQRDMKRLIREFGQKLKSGGSGLFYYAGHGVQSNGRNYLIPVEADIQSEAEVEDSSVDVSLVLKYMDEAQNGLNVVILDACRNNPFSRSFRSASSGLAQVDAPTGTLIAYATAPGHVASDGTAQNGLYTSELLKQMRVPGLSATEMFMRVRAEVMKQTANKQVPWEASSLVGSFYFASPKNTEGTRTSEPASETKIDVVAVEREYWETIRGSNDTQDYKDYLQTYPNGAYAGVARAKIRQLKPAKNTRPVDSQPSNAQPSNSGGNKTSEPASAAKTSASPPKGFRSQQEIEMVYIPPGQFMMGAENGQPSEKPVHRVMISHGFYMGKYEVTQAQWQAVMGTSVRQQRDKRDGSYNLMGEGDSYPMYFVSWNEAQEFVRKLNEINNDYSYHLPTEAQWEYACRADTTGDYAGTLDAMAWYGNNSGEHYLDLAELVRTDNENFIKRLYANGNQTHPVGTKQANAYGLYDMYGNVTEWCEDWYHGTYAGGPTDGSAWLSGGEQKDRVLRGGSWLNTAAGSRSANRGRSFPDDRFSNRGFRVVAILRTQ